MRLRLFGELRRREGLWCPPADEGGAGAQPAHRRASGRGDPVGILDGQNANSAWGLAESDGEADGVWARGFHWPLRGPFDGLASQWDISHALDLTAVTKGSRNVLLCRIGQVDRPEPPGQSGPCNAPTGAQVPDPTADPSRKH